MDKFSKGEIAEYHADTDAKGIIKGCWVDCEIVLFEGYLDGVPVYLIRIPGDLGPVDGGWHTLESDLRKKKPRENPDVLETQGKVYDSTLTPWQPPKIEVEQ